MCGIVGIFSSSAVDKKLIDIMSEALIKRGPDSKGSYFDKSNLLAFGHRRLSILDLSNNGHQPMISSDKRWVICYNGEIYNHKYLRNELLRSGFKISWRGNSDTETLLSAVEKWGLDKTLKKLNGMFAFALWDQKKRELYLCRDRIGEKPLYYGKIKNSFVFASEIKAIKKHPYWKEEIDINSLSEFIRYSYIPSPKSIYKNIKKLPQAHYIKIVENGSNISEPINYWNIYEQTKSKLNLNLINQKEIYSNIENLIEKSVKSRMLSDVPIGAFLSGGIDSSYIVAKMQSISDTKVKTFSIGNIDQNYDEANKAQKISEHLGTDHNHLYINSKNILDIVPDISSIFDEPFADASQIPTLMVSKLAKKQVKVCLSGDGGDELFGGYDRHVKGPRFWLYAEKIPIYLRKLISKKFSKNIILKLFEYLYLLYTRNKINPEFENQIFKILNSLQARNGREFYELIRTISFEKGVVDLTTNNLLINDKDYNFDNLSEEFIFYDIISYLPDDILTKVDRTSMSQSLEVRVPYLDHKLLEYCLKIPASLKIKNGEGKWILKQLLKKYLPNQLIVGKKKGFTIPISFYLKNSLRDWAENLLDFKNINNHGLINSTIVKKKWTNFLNGQKGLENEIWCILMFQSWICKQNE